MMPRTGAITFEIESNTQYGRQMEVVAPDYRRFPVRLTIPAPEGAFDRQQKLSIRDEQGKAATCQARPFVYWPDQTVRVWEVWMPLDLSPGQRRAYAAQVGSTRKPQANN